MNRRSPTRTIIGQPNFPLPRRYRRIVEKVCQRDREYFEQHPAATTYTRDYIPGEAWPVRMPQGTRVQVNVLAPGIRSRWLVPPGVDGAA